jgi:hypothetical protein
VIPADEFTRLMHLALADKSAEPDFFRALLEATVYAHVPRNSRDGRLRFIQFTTPAGLTVLPFFTDELQARTAAGSAATIVVLTGRQLLEWTRGATLMLNPNEISCTLYPEEIALLLDHGEMAVVEQIDTGDQQLWIDTTCEPPAWLINRLVALYAGLDCVEAAYLADIGAQEGSEQHGLLVAIAVSAKDAERVARATTTELQLDCQALQATIDLTAFEPSDPPVWLKETGLGPFYVRAMGERIGLGPQGLQ